MFKEKGPFEGLLSPELIVVTSKNRGVNDIYNECIYILLLLLLFLLVLSYFDCACCLKTAIDHALVIPPI